MVISDIIAPENNPSNRDAPDCRTVEMKVGILSERFFARDMSMQRRLWLNSKTGLSIGKMSTSVGSKLSILC